MSSALCRTNSSGQRSVFPTTPGRRRAPSCSRPRRPGSAPWRAAPRPRCTKPNVRAPASSDANVSAFTTQRPFCAPMSGCGKSIDTSRSSTGDGCATYTDSPSTTRTRSREAQLLGRAAVPDDPGRRRAPRRTAARCRRESAARRRSSRSRRRRCPAPTTAASTCSTVCRAAVAVAELRAALGQRRVRPRAPGSRARPARSIAAEDDARFRRRRRHERERARRARGAARRP